MLVKPRRLLSVIILLVNSHPTTLSFPPTQEFSVCIMNLNYTILNLVFMVIIYVGKIIYGQVIGEEK